MTGWSSIIQKSIGTKTQYGLQDVYLLNVMKKSKVWTDHENLKCFRKLHKLNEGQAR